MKDTHNKKGWEFFWKERRETLWGKLLFFIREKFLTKPFVKIAEKYTSSGVILEAGCGSALCSILLSKKRGDKVLALDISQEALNIAQDLAKKYNVAVELQLANISKIPLKDKALDLVWNIGTLEHFPKPFPILKEMSRVGKTVICIVPERNLVWRFFLKIMEKLSKTKPEYIKLYSSKELKQLFQRVGFDEVKVERVFGLFVFTYLAGIGFNKI